MRRRVIGALIALSLIVIGLVGSSAPASATSIYGWNDPACNNVTFHQVGYHNSPWVSDGRNQVSVTLYYWEGDDWWNGVRCGFFFIVTNAKPSQSVNDSPLTLRMWAGCYLIFNGSTWPGGWDDVINTGNRQVGPSGSYFSGCTPGADDSGTNAGTYGGFYYGHPYVTW